MAMKNQVLVLTDEAVLPVQGMGDLVNGSIPADATTITYCLELEGKLPFQNASLDLAIAVLQSIERFGNRWFEEIRRVVKPSGKIVVQTYVPSSHHKKLSSWLERQLLLSGFIELQALQSQSPLPGEGSIAVTIEGKRPSWTIGSSFALKNARNALPKIRNEEAPDFIDEDSLLTDEDYVKPRLPSGSATDCKTTSTRKACKNCTCGRAGAAAEAEERLWLTAEQMSNPQSACGSCGLGDAFRCGGCPYRGLPPFKLGEKVSLPSNFLVTDM